MIRKFPIPPGVDRQGTRHSIGARWYESNNVRFRDKDPESIGGWARNESHTLQGFGRGIHSWLDFSDNQYICVGTNFKFYILVGTNKYDVTPNRNDSGTVQKDIIIDTNPFATVEDSSVITVTHTNHLASVNDFVVFRTISADDVGGIAPSIFTGGTEGYQIVSVTDDDTYTIDLASGSQTGTIEATSTALTEGGTVEVSYRVNSGVVSDASGSGWGVGAFGGDDVIPTAFTLGNNPLTTVGAASAQIDVATNGIPTSAFVAGDYIYLMSLTGSFDGVDSTFFNDKWWLVDSVAGGDARFTGVELATAGSIAGGGTTPPTFYHDDVSEGGVVGASRGWGEASTASMLTDALRIVTIQNFGEDLMFCNRGGPLYYYDVRSNTTVGIPSSDDKQAIEISSTGASAISGATEPPTTVDSFLIAEGHGHCVAIACNDIGAPDQNNMLIRWSDRHNPFVWLPTNSNEAGGRILREGSQLYGGITTKDEILIFTNTAIYSMKYIGYPETYGFIPITKGIGAYSRGSYVAVDNMIFMMGRDQFYMYDGSIQPLSKNLVNYVFDDINDDEKDKCFSAVNSKYTEVLWFYPTSGSFEPDRWVSYNYSNQTWAHGSYDMSSLASTGAMGTSNRTAWHDVDIFNDPMASYVTAYDPSAEPELQTSSIMNHETGRNANNAAMDVSIESGKIDITEGDMYMHYSRILPDVESVDLDSSAASPQVTLSIEGQNLPGRTETQTASVTVDFSDQTDSDLNYAPDYNATAVRGRARTISFKASSSSTGFGWRLGAIRLDLKPDGRR